MPKNKQSINLECKENEPKVATTHLRRSARLSSINAMSSTKKEVNKAQEIGSPLKKKKRASKIKDEPIEMAKKISTKMEVDEQKESDIEFANDSSSDDKNLYVASENESSESSIASESSNDDEYEKKPAKRRAPKQLVKISKNAVDKLEVEKERLGLRKLAKSSNLFSTVTTNFRMTLEHFKNNQDQQSTTSINNAHKPITVLLPKLSNKDLSSSSKLSQHLVADTDIDMPSTSSANRPPSSLSKNSGGIFSSDDDGEDEWHELESIEQVVERETAIQVDIAGPSNADELEEGKYEKLIRQEIARKRRECFENSHKMHILCYIAHLRYWVRFSEENRSKFLPNLNEFLPTELQFTRETITPKLMEKLVKWIYKKFTQSEIAPWNVEEALDSNAVTKEAANFSLMFTSKTYQTDKDLALLVFALLRAMKLAVRLLVSIDPVPRVEEKNESTNSDVLVKQKSKEKSNLKARKSTVKKNKDDSDFEEEEEDDEELSDDVYENKKKSRRKSKKAVAPKVGNIKNVSSAKKALKMRKNMIEAEQAKAYTKGTRDYWIEYYDDGEDRWICVDAMFNTVDSAMSIEKAASEQMLYVFGMDNDLHVRDLTARYVSAFLTKAFRSFRTDEAWLKETMALPLFAGNMKKSLRDSIEDLEIRRFLESLPLPIIIADYKNHPLYVLEKDLLKFEAIYPPDIKPIGEVRGYKIFPRSSVHVLQPGEKPYKVVKARPKLAIPKEKRVPLTLDVYGYWQTVPYMPPKVVDGKIPRNDFANVYMYQPQMVPCDCVHLKLNGIYNIARKMDIEAVPAVTGWDFKGARNVPLIEGCVVLKKDEQVLRDAWKEMQQKKKEREAKKIEERVWKNWKRLIKGKLLLEKMRNRFVT